MTNTHNSLLKFFDPQSRKSVNQYFREKRFGFFRQMLRKAGFTEDAGIRILDIGGTVDFWRSMNFMPHKNMNITLLNLQKCAVPNVHFTSIQGDACDLSQFKEKEFDIVFSNSVIEHLFTKRNQEKMALEVRRVGKHYYIQTPNYYFPIEPHWMFPFFHYLPFGLRTLLTRNFSLGHIEKAKSREDAFKKVQEVRLLTIKEMKALFPEGKIYEEKFFGLTKSITIHTF